MSSSSIFEFNIELAINNASIYLRAFSIFFIKTFQDGNPLPLGDEKVLLSLILDIFLNCSGGNLAYTAYKIAI